MICVRVPLIIPKQKREDKRKIKLFTAEEVECMIYKAIATVCSSEIIQKNEITVKPIFAHNDSAIDIYITQGDLATKQRIDVPREYGGER